MKNLVKTLLLLLLVITNCTSSTPQIDKDDSTVFHGGVIQLISGVDVTMYNPVPEQTNSQPDVVADGTRFDVTQASELRWLAVSRDLHERWGGPLSFNQAVFLNIPNSEKTGVYIVKDIMNARFTNRVDILETVGQPIYSYTNGRLYEIKWVYDDAGLLEENFLFFSTSKSNKTPEEIVFNQTPF